MRTLITTSLSLWKTSWNDKSFRLVTIFSTLIILFHAVFLPFFFQHLEKRSGIILEDYLLQIIPAKDVSLCIFLIVFGSLFYIIGRSIFSPDIFIRFLSAYASVLIFRSISLYLLPLEPPAQLIPLIDPWSPIFSGGQIVTKDLFFSGHTSTTFLVFLCLSQKFEKQLMLFASILMAFLLLMQHVHYTIDIIAAFLFTYLSFLISRKIIQ